METAQVIRRGPLDIQVCIPNIWNNEQVIEFANKETLCGTTLGWVIRKEGSEHLKGSPERNPCESRVGFVHIMLDA